MTRRMSLFQCRLDVFDRSTRVIDEKVDFVSEFTGQNHEEIAIPQDPDQSPKRIVAVDGSWARHIVVYHSESYVSAMAFLLVGQNQYRRC